MLRLEPVIPKTPFAFSFSLLGIVLIYRIQLTWSLFTYSVRPFDFDPSRHPFWVMIRDLSYDLGLVLLSFGGSWLVYRAFRPILRKKGRPWLNTLAVAITHLLLLGLALLHQAHLRLLFEAQTGMGYFVLQELLHNVPKVEIFKFVGWQEIVALLLPIGLFWGVFLLPFPLRRRLLQATLGGGILLFAFSGLASLLHPAPLPAELRSNPTLSLFADLGEEVRRKVFQEEEGPPLPSGEMASREASPIFTPNPLASDRRWNIVLFIMESVGSRYIFDPTEPGRIPMPFLQSLARESWYLERHFTTSNITTKAVFSLLSGRYDLFSQEMFGTRPDAFLPSLLAFLPEGYEAFLVTPSPLQWYFPAAFVKNSGLKEIYHFDNLTLRKREEKNAFGRYLGRDEVETIDFFNRRIQRAKEPFLAIYLSFAAHLPYFDYGSEYHLVPPDMRMISRYYNNLNLLDHMLKRVYDRLKQEGLLGRTILVIAGDHGQAFGQHHPDNFMHHRYSYNENLATPMMFHQPALFRPRSIQVPTSHVDLLPTLLDALRIPYVPHAFDGESLFHPRLGRRYIFAYGYEGTLNSIDAHWIKVQYSLKTRTCRAFDLKIDPEEIRPLDCTAFQHQLEALQTFALKHNLHLLQDNERIKEAKGSDGTLVSTSQKGREEGLVKTTRTE
ncbi:MAG: sulfatase-like hydrolase/transferase [Desulfobacterota bacterium]|nr:sulfatase-like hydrolase/transferase [Thermodesulfobacteriota bacterium]